MAEIIGRDSVKTFITNSGKKKFKIYGVTDSLKATPRWQSTTGNDPADDFEKWAAMVDNAGTNTTEYKIKCYDVEEDDSAEPKRGGDRKTGAVITTFCLYPNVRVPAQVNGAQQQPVYAGATIANMTLEQLRAALGSPAPQPQQVDVAAAITAAVEKTAHIYQLQILKNSNDQLVKNLTAQLADMREDMHDAMEEEEEEEEQQAIIKAAEITANAEKEKLATIGQIVKDNAPVIKELVYHFFPGMGKPAGQLQAASNVAVNGPSISAEKKTGWQVPVSDKKGELPPFPSARKEKADPEDQAIKIKTATDFLYTETNDELGDDLMLLVKMAKDMPAKYEEIILKLREQMK